jgi:hypothetical protein
MEAIRPRKPISTTLLAAIALTGAPFVSPPALAAPAHHDRAHKAAPAAKSMIFDRWGNMITQRSRHAGPTRPPPVRDEPRPRGSP